MLTAIEFANEAFTDFSSAENQKKMEAALNNVKAELGKKYPLLIGEEQIETEDEIISTNPANPSQIIGRFSKANTTHAELAMKAATKSFNIWKDVPATTRAEYLFKVASLIRSKKFELSAWLILEIGKSWAEADGDVAEAIDFCEFYAREMIRLAGPQPLTFYPGEKNSLSYIPLGIGLVIPPWNFPLAILVGMTTAAFVSGNTVILKPSSETPAIAYKFMEILKEAGLPPGVVNFIPGPGSSVGDYLVGHAQTRFIAFTGSKEVGLRINELAAKTTKGQLWIKRVIAEMGGKDAIVVDAQADLDAAADGIVASAFGFQGQKCSACSRAIIHKEVYDLIVQKVLERARKISLGPVEDKANNFGPVSSKSAYESILNYIEIGKKEGKLALGGKTVDKDGGYFIEPTIIIDVDNKARISQEEIFGPVLALTKAKDFDQAIAFANDTEFGLTGAVYSTSRQHLDLARKDFHVGNLYLNRKCTGALVGVHPFGGFNMSGTDSKAGGRDYLLLFTQAKLVSEKE